MAERASDRAQYLKEMHTTLLLSRDKYRVSLTEASDAQLRSLFASMIKLRANDADEIADLLIAINETAELSGSLLTSLDETICEVRSTLSMVDENVVRGMLDHESLILAEYDTALSETRPYHAEFSVLTSQRATLRQTLFGIATGGDRRETARRKVRNAPSDTFVLSGN